MGAASGLRLTASRSASGHDNIFQSLTGNHVDRFADWVPHFGVRSGTIESVRICLLPSPLATSAVAGPLAVALRERGHEAVVADNGGTDPEQVLARFVAAARGAAVVVPHSNAGRFGPAVADAVGARPTA